MMNAQHIFATLTSLTLAACGFACAETDGPQSPTERFHGGDTIRVGERIDYQEKDIEVEGDTPIRALLELEESEPVWAGFGSEDPYPTGGKATFNEEGTSGPCEPVFQNKVYQLDQLPATIEGVVTLAPRHYEKRGFCGQDHRYYGTYYIQDATGSILVMKDSGISDFTYGDRVRLRVRGIKKSFGTTTVVAADEVEIDRERSTVPFERVESSFTDRLGSGENASPDAGNNFRVTGRVCQEPNNRNFSEMVLQKDRSSCSDEDTSWTVSLGLELGRRGVDLENGDTVTVTGPVQLSFGEYALLSTSLGQIQRFNRSK